MRMHLLCLASAAALIAGVAEARIYNDVTHASGEGRMGELNDELVSLNAQMRTLQATADAQNRVLSDDEATELDRIMARFDEVDGEITRRTEIENRNQRLAQPLGRRTDADDVVNADRDQPTRPGARRALPNPRNAEDAARHGFRSFGEFASQVKNAVRSSPGSIDPRLIANAAPGDPAREGSGEDGGFLVPPEFRRDIVTKIMGPESLLSRCDQQISSGNTYTYPVDETTPGGTSGIRAFWTAEGGLKQQTKPVLGEASLKLNKLAALVPVTDELLEDAPSLSSYLRTRTPEVMDAEVNDAIIRGTGAGMPKGILNSGALVTVAKESGQAADTVVYKNIVNMWARLDAKRRANAIWLVNQDVDTQLMNMEFPVTGGATAIPAYLPPGGLASEPNARLLNRPVIAVDSTSALGDVGDIMLVDLKAYLALTKVGGIKQDVSIHLWFDYDVTAFRFVMRVGGQPWFDKPITPRNSSLTRSPFVALADRA